MMSVSELHTYRVMALESYLPLTHFRLILGYKMSIKYACFARNNQFYVFSFKVGIRNGKYAIVLFILPDKRGDWDECLL